jgi:uncharacterized membrane protein
MGDAAATGTEVTRWVLLSDWGPGTLGLVIALCVAVVALAAWNVRALAPRRRGVLIALRALTVVILLGLFLQPGRRTESVSRVRNHVVVLVDDSRSMGLPGERGDSRLDEARAAIEAQSGTRTAWSSDHIIDFYGVSERARPVQGPDELRADGDASRLLVGLNEIGQRYNSDALAAVLVYSDGADNGVLGAAVTRGDLGAVRDVVGRLGAPVHTFFTGPDTPPRDVAITQVRYDEFAFVHNAVSIEAEITVTGGDSASLPVTLRRDDVVLTRRVLETRRGETTYPFVFEFVPDKTGKAIFTLEVGGLPDERITDNNRRQFVVRVIRDKIRALQVVGRPSWDERFLRQLLKRNPNVDLISFFILRTSESLTLASPDEMSLIPFPTDELFRQQLGSFDVIFFQNFDWAAYDMSPYLEGILEFVRRGGGFVMTGGDRSFASGNYANTPIAEFLPVELRTPGSASEAIDVAEFQPRLTEAGRNHPITRLSLARDENEALWAGLPALRGLNLVSGVKQGAAVLLEHPDLKRGGAPAPVVVAGSLGTGRVLAVLTDTAWHWDFKAAANGGDNRHYYRFFGNAMRWLMKDPALEPVRVEADRDRYPLGAEATFHVRVLGADYQPARGARVRLEVTRQVFAPAGTAPEAPPTAERAFEVEEETNDQGELVVRWRPPGDGGYGVRVFTQVGGVDVRDEDVFVVSADPVELRQIEARRETLEALSTQSGGRFNALSTRWDSLERNPPRVSRVHRRSDDPLWAGAPWLLLAVLLPSAEWLLRRRWGLS